MYHPLYCPTAVSEKKKESRKKRERRAAIWNSNPCLPVLSFSPKVSQSILGREIENADTISLFPGQGYDDTGITRTVKNLLDIL